MHCLLARGQRLISEHQSYSNTPTPCPELPHFTHHNEQSHFSWALSLIQYFQHAQSNIYTTPLFPQPTSHIHCTQTPLHTFYNQDNDTPLILNDILDFENSYHIYFVEELFPYPPTHPTTFLPNILKLFPTQYHTYLERITFQAFTNPSLTLGQIIIRENIIIKLSHNPNPVYIEGIHPAQSDQQFAIRTQTWTPRNPNHTQNIIHLCNPHSQSTSIATTTTQPSTYCTTRYIHSSIGYNPTEAYCQSTAIQQKIHPCQLPKFTEVYAPPQIKCDFHQSIIDSWNTYPLESTTPIAVYTDGSLKTEEQPTTLAPHSPPRTVSSAVVFYEKTTHPTPWQNRNVVAIQLRLPPNTNSTNYTAEVLAATIATALPGSKETHIYTDALGLISSLTKTTKLNTLSPLHSPPLLHRDYTDTGILYKHLVQHYPHTTYTHVKAHQEDHENTIPTEHGTGNKLADLIAQNKLSEAKLIAPNIKIFTYTH